MQNPDIIVVDKKKLGRPIKENGPTKDKEYFKKYYHLRLSKLIRCDVCQSCVNIQKIKTHQKTKKCAKWRDIPVIIN